MTHLPNTSAKILVVDDTPHNLSVICECLEQANLDVLVAESGENALDTLHYVTPDLILLDVMMPGIDGFETCRRLKADPRTAAIPIIFMTALADLNSKVKGFQIGAVDYITKPFQQEEVLVRIGTHLQLHQIMQAMAESNAQLQHHIQKQQATERQLRDTIQKLRTTQHRLIEAEKLSSLGTMIGGVAHEINNPLTFIKGNIEHLSDYFDDFIELVQWCEAIEGPLPPDFKAHLETVDIPFLLKDVPNTLQSVAFGASRIERIIDALKSFAHLDQSGQKPIHLNDAIDNTLLILRPYFKKHVNNIEIKIHKHYAQNLPTLHCYPEHINQVLFHLLQNAIDAVNVSQVTAPAITLETDNTVDCVSFSIHDNGVGISDEVYPHIFDPFFTTKPVGQGAGLGLSTTYETIVERHQGTIECTSTPATGTTFTVLLPIRPVIQQCQQQLHPPATQAQCTLTKGSTLQTQIAPTVESPAMGTPTMGSTRVINTLGPVTNTLGPKVGPKV